MIIRGKKLWFSTALVILSADEARAIAGKREYFDFVQIIGHEQLDISGFSCKQKTTGIVDLTSADAVLAGFNKTTRNEIARTYRETGLSFGHHDAITDAGYELYAAFERTAGRKPYARARLSGCMEFLGYDGGVLVSGMFVYPSEPIMRIRSIFSARRAATEHHSRQRIGYASRRLMFDVCTWGIEHGRTGLDLASLNFDNPKTRSISEFKSGFSPRIVPEYHYAYRSFPYRCAEYIMGAFRGRH